ncbi:MAG: hypothetical protein HN725_03820 [Alphaproteobacteria bacterium]|jgi:hypothetical protein|nr:hypothetical protein [Alphaproteobacteria bacterium]MBT4083778.1 hypothetical protein [Alphaproteobacteria bacterium]MBT4542270.1 hypothetical protein [Alphaproteobacteria bacterium]MBT7744393.1 hypothetical protein [Alphaproteobacteria bacterium]
MSTRNTDDELIEGIQRKATPLTEIIDNMTPDQKWRSSHAFHNCVAKSVADGDHPMQGVADAMAEAFNNKFEAELMVKRMLKQDGD